MAYRNNGNIKYATIKVLRKNQYRTECPNDRGISLVAQARKVFLKVIAGRPSDFSKREYILPEEQGGFGSLRSTVDMMLEVR